MKRNFIDELRQSWQRPRATDMFERFKRLFRRKSLDVIDSEPTGSPEPPEAPPTPPPRLDEVVARRTPSPAPAPASAPTPTPPSAPAPAAAVTPKPPTGDVISVSLRAVVLKLPETLKGKVRQAPTGGVRVSVPVQKVVSQLNQGSVRIPFGDLRKAAPPGVFSDSSDRDHTLVELPLQEILAQLKPDQLPRRAAQKKVEVPDDVTPVFGPRGHQTEVRIAHPAKPEVPRPAPAPTVPAPTSAPAARGPHAPPAAPPSTIKPSAPLPPPSALKPPAQPTWTAPSPPPIKPSAPSPTQSAPAAAPAAKPTAAAAAAPAPKPVAAPAPTAPAPAGKEEYVAVPLVSVTLGWPEPIRQALAGLNVPDAVLNLPVSETEQALKRGKVVFQWKRLKPLIKPPLKTALAPALDEVQLELPLPAVAPLFMAQRKPVAAQKKYAVAEDIPDVFSVKGILTPALPVSAPEVVPASPPAAPAPAPTAPKPAPAPIPMARPPAPVARPEVAPAIAAAPASPARPAGGTLPLEIGELFGQPGRKNWAPAEIVQRTAALPGVSGAVITMQDGLLVAGHLPPGLNGEAIAAFLPQMFSRMMQYCKELKFGETDTFTLVVDNVALRIHRAGGLYFAALGRSNEALPDPQLRLIATHLAPQSK